MKVCIFAASSSRIDEEYKIVASRLGTLLAKTGKEVVFGGGGIGLMGIIADAVLANGGKITGVIPSFMKEEGWSHCDVNEMIVTEDMSQRKKTMFGMSDAVIALPGGVGTLEELTEAITLKQLGLFKGPIIILNTLNFYNSFIDFLGHMISGHFLRNEHKGIWEIATTPEEVIIALTKNKGWIDDPRRMAKI